MSASLCYAAFLDQHLLVLPSRTLGRLIQNSTICMRFDAHQITLLKVDCALVGLIELLLIILKNLFVIQTAFQLQFCFMAH